MLGGIWQFLKDPANLAVLGSIGAVIAAIAAGAWAVFTLFAKKSEKGPSALRLSRSLAAKYPGNITLDGPMSVPGVALPHKVPSCRGGTKARSRSTREPRQEGSAVIADAVKSGKLAQT